MLPSRARSPLRVPGEDGGLAPRLVWQYPSCCKPEPRNGGTPAEDSFQPGGMPGCGRAPRVSLLDPLRVSGGEPRGRDAVRRHHIYKLAGPSHFDVHRPCIGRQILQSNGRKSKAIQNYDTGHREAATRIQRREVTGIPAIIVLKLAPRVIERVWHLMAQHPVRAVGVWDQVGRSHPW